MADEEKKAVKRFSDSEIDQIVNWLMVQIGPVGDKFQDIFRSFNFMKLVNLVMYLAGMIELATTVFKGFSGPDKKKVLVKYLNRVIDLPYLDERMEAWAIEMVIDQVIEWLNRVKGKKWAERLKLKAV